MGLIYYHFYFDCPCILLYLPPPLLYSIFNRIGISFAGVCVVYILQFNPLNKKGYTKI